MSRIFLSHSSADNAAAMAICQWLAEEGWSDVFLDLDPERGIKAGEQWEEALRKATDRCEAVLFLVSHAWLGSEWCRDEFRLARHLRKRLFGILIEDIATGDLPTLMTRDWQLVNIAAAGETKTISVVLPKASEAVEVRFSAEGLRRLKLGLLAAGLDSRFFAWPPPDDPDRPPYRGLLPLEAEDAGIFFGRDAPMVEALDRLRALRDTAAPRLMVVIGASGSGKSSFLRAGLLPRLARDDRNFLSLPILRPARAAISGETGLVRALEAALQAMALPHVRAEIRDAVAGGAKTLQPLLARLVEAARPSMLSDEPRVRAPIIVLPIDQGEELFLAEGTDEADELLTILRDLLVGDSPAVLALVTIRSDSYERLQTAKAIDGIRQETMSLPPMPRGAYQRVIEGPAERLRDTSRALTIDPALTQALLADVDSGSGRDALPLLAFTIERLYLEYRGRGRLTFADYKALGGIKGSIEAAIERALVAADADPKIPRDRGARLLLLRRGLIPWLAGNRSRNRRPASPRCAAFGDPGGGTPINPVPGRAATARDRHSAGDRRGHHRACTRGFAPAMGPVGRMAGGGCGNSLACWMASSARPEIGRQMQRMPRGSRTQPVGSQPLSGCEIGRILRRVSNPRTGSISRSAASASTRSSARGGACRHLSAYSSQPSARERPPGGTGRG